MAIPARAVLTLQWLNLRGISGKLANYYVKAGWLHRVGEGAFTVTAESPDWLGAVFGLQQKQATLHPGGQTALELAGVAHFLPLGTEAPLYLFGRSGERLPKWFTGLPWSRRVRYVQSAFLPPDLGLRDHSTGGFSIRISDPERAILELLLHVTPDSEGYSHADLLFENLGTLRPSLVQLLLENCTSVKVKRLFLHFGEKHAHPWFPQVDMSKISIGRGKRVFVRGGQIDPKYHITVPAVTATPDDAP